MMARNCSPAVRYCEGFGLVFRPLFIFLDGQQDIQVLSACHIRLSIVTVHTHTHTHTHTHQLFLILDSTGGEGRIAMSDIDSAGQLRR